jgi:hypothetical protein
MEKSTKFRFGLDRGAISAPPAGRLKRPFRLLCCDRMRLVVVLHDANKELQDRLPDTYGLYTYIPGSTQLRNLLPSFDGCGLI